MGHEKTKASTENIVRDRSNQDLRRRPQTTACDLIGLCQKTNKKLHRNFLTDARYATLLHKAISYSSD